MGAGAGKTLLLCEANGPSVNSASDVWPEAVYWYNNGTKIWTFALSLSHSLAFSFSFSLSLSLSLSLYFFSHSHSLVHAAVKHSKFFPLNYQLSTQFMSYQQDEFSSSNPLLGWFYMSWFCQAVSVSDPALKGTLAAKVGAIIHAPWELEAHQILPWLFSKVIHLQPLRMMITTIMLTKPHNDPDNWPIVGFAAHHTWGLWVNMYSNDSDIFILV